MLTSLVMILLLGAAQAAPNSRIVGGSDAELGEFPHQVSLRQFGSHICGGSLIAPNYVLTAGHCVGSLAFLYNVGVGMHDRTITGGQSETIGVAEITRHPGYDNGSGGFTPNDLAVIRLSSPVTLGDRVGIIDLAESSFVGSTCVISGWGRLSGDGTTPTILQRANVYVYDDSHCVGKFGDSFVSDIHKCVDNDDISACNGDSGGPLTCMQNGVPKLAGVTSWGIGGCPANDSPSVYVEVKHYLTWIRSFIN